MRATHQQPGRCRPSHAPQRCAVPRRERPGHASSIPYSCPTRRYTAPDGSVLWEVRVHSIQYQPMDFSHYREQQPAGSRDPAGMPLNLRGPAARPAFPCIFHGHRHACCAAVCHLRPPPHAPERPPMCRAAFDSFDLLLELRLFGEGCAVVLGAGPGLTAQPGRAPQGLHQQRQRSCSPAACMPCPLRAQTPPRLWTC